MASKLTKAEWYKDENGFIKGELIADATDWVNSLGYDSITYLDLNGEAHELNATGRDRGKVAYIGSINEAINGKPYVTVTVINQRASVPNESYTGSNEVVDRLWDDYQSNNSTPKKPKKRTVRQRPKEQTEAEKKKRNVLRDKALFGRLSLDPQDTQAAYLIAKEILGFIPRGKVRYGHDKQGNFAAIQLFDVSGREFKGLQRFYDRNIKGRDTNKDFTWGLVKKGACHILGDIDKDYAGIVYICEGYADGTVILALTSAPVFIALDAYNLDAVTQAVKAEYPKAQGVVVCDNDAYKYAQGVDNTGVLRGVEAASKAGYQFVIPDFSGWDNESKPKDLWNLWKLGGDEAVEALLNSPQKHSENELFTWDFLGLKSLLGAMKKVAQKAIQLTNPQKAVEAVANAIVPHAGRLDINTDMLSEHANKAADNALKSLIKRITARYKGRLVAANQTVNIKKDLDGVELNHKTLVMESGMGTGKTEWLKQNVFCNQGLENVLAILPRRILAKVMAERVGAVDYEEVKSASPKKLHYMDTRKLVGVSNSLEKLGFTGNEQLDVIVLDESDLNFQHLFGGTFSGFERTKTFNILKGLVKNAEYVICCQAQITQVTMEFLRVCGREDIHVIRNESQRYEGLKTDLFAKKADNKMRLDEVIEKGNPVAVPCTSAKFARGLALELSRKFPNRRVFEIDRDNCNDPEQAKFLANLATELKKIDVLIYTPVIEQGVSFDEPRFKYVVGFCDAGEGFGTPDGFAQMLFRSRYVEQLSLHVDPRIDSQPTDTAEYLLEAATRYNTTCKAVEIDGKLCGVFEITDEVRLAAQIKAAEAAAKNRTQQEVYAILAYMGCDITIRDAMEADNSAGVEALKSAKNLQKIEHNEQVANAPKITPSECKEIEDSTKATLEDNYKV
ncbi:MAG: plasmid replication protein, CyRepA1 family, partial [Chloroflexota bacterium]